MFNDSLEEKSGELYADARNWFRERFFSGQDEIIAIYEYGTVRAPGLSDLDILLVCKDDAEKYRVAELLSDCTVPHKYRCLIDENSLKVVSERHFLEIRYLGEIQTKLIAGRKINSTLLTASDSEAVRLLNLMDWMPERLYAINQQIQKPVSTANAISIIRKLVSFQHSLINYSTYSKHYPSLKDEKTEKFILDLDAFRRDWITSYNTILLTELINLCHVAIDLGIGLLRNISDHLVDLNKINSQSATGRFELGEQGGLRSDPHVEIDYCSPDKMRELLRHYWIPVPGCWMEYLYYCSQIGGPISDLISRQLRINQDSLKLNVADGKLSPIIVRRIELSNSIFDFVYKSGLGKGHLYRYGHLV